MPTDPFQAGLDAARRRRDAMAQAAAGPVDQTPVDASLADPTAAVSATPVADEIRAQGGGHGLLGRIAGKALAPVQLAGQAIGADLIPGKHKMSFSDFLNAGVDYGVKPGIGAAQIAAINTGLTRMPAEQRQRILDAYKQGGFTGAYEERWKGEPGWAKFLAEGELDPLNAVGGLGKGLKAASVAQEGGKLAGALRGGSLLAEGVDNLQALPITLPVRGVKGVGKGIGAAVGAVAPEFADNFGKKLSKLGDLSPKARAERRTRSFATAQDFLNQSGVDTRQWANMEGNLAPTAVNDLVNTLNSMPGRAQRATLLNSMPESRLGRIWDQLNNDPTQAGSPLLNEVTQSLQRDKLLIPQEGGGFAPSSKLRTHMELDAVLDAQQVSPTTRDVMHGLVDAAAVGLWDSNKRTMKLDDAYDLINVKSVSSLDDASTKDALHKKWLYEATDGKLLNQLKKVTPNESIDRLMSATKDVAPEAEKWYFHGAELLYHAGFDYSPALTDDVVEATLQMPAMRAQLETYGIPEDLARQKLKSLTKIDAILALIGAGSQNSGPLENLAVAFRAYRDLIDGKDISSALQFPDRTPNAYMRLVDDEAFLKTDYLRESRGVPGPDGKVKTTTDRYPGPGKVTAIANKMDDYSHNFRKEYEAVVAYYGSKAEGQSDEAARAAMQQAREGFDAFTNDRWNKRGVLDTRFWIDPEKIRAGELPPIHPQTRQATFDQFGDTPVEWQAVKTAGYDLHYPFLTGKPAQTSGQVLDQISPDAAEWAQRMPNTGAYQARLWGLVNIQTNAGSDIIRDLQSDPQLLARVQAMGDDEMRDWFKNEVQNRIEKAVEDGTISRLQRPNDSLANLIQPDVTYGRYPDPRDVGKKKVGPPRPILDDFNRIRPDLEGAGFQLPDGRVIPYTESDGTRAIDQIIGGDYQHLLQQGRTGIQGTFVPLGPNGKAQITLTSESDPTTLAHELAHLYRRFASPEDQARIAKALGRPLTEGMDRPAEEWFAQGFENLLRSGDLDGLPPELQDIIGKWRQISQQAYLHGTPRGVLGDELDKTLTGRLAGNGPQLIGDAPETGSALPAGQTVSGTAANPTPMGPGTLPLPEGQVVPSSATEDAERAALGTDNTAGSLADETDEAPLSDFDEMRGSMALDHMATAKSQVMQGGSMAKAASQLADADIDAAIRIGEDLGYPDDLLGALRAEQSRRLSGQATQTAADLGTAQSADSTYVQLRQAWDQNQPLDQELSSMPNDEFDDLAMYALDRGAADDLAPNEESFINRIGQEYNARVKDGRLNQTARSANPELVQRANAGQATADDIRELVNSGQYATLTAWREGVDEATNRSNYERLRQLLIDRGYHPYEADGVYQGSAEPSFLVAGLSRDDAARLGNEFKQDSVLGGSEGLLYHDGRVNPRSGAAQFDVDPNDFFTRVKLPDGSTVEFTQPINFDQTTSRSTPIEGPQNAGRPAQQIPVDDNVFLDQPHHDASINETLRNYAVQHNVPVEQADKVSTILQPIADRNPNQWQALELTQTPEIRKHLDAALAAPDEQTMRNELAAAMQAMDQTWSAFGIQHPYLSKVAGALPNAKRTPARSTEAFGRQRLGSTLRDSQAEILREAAEMPEVKAADEAYQTGRKSVEDVLSRMREGMGSRIPEIKDSTTLGEIRELGKLADPADRKVIEDFFQEFAPEVNVATAYSHSRILAHQAAVERELGIVKKTPGKLARNLSMIPKVWRAQALLSPAYHAKNATDMLFRSVVYGVNPLKSPRTAFAQAERWGVQLPNLQGTHVAEQLGNIGRSDSLNPLSKLTAWNRQLAATIEDTFRLAAWSQAARDHLATAVMPRFRGEVARVGRQYGQDAAKSGQIIKDLQQLGTHKGVDFSPQQVFDTIKAHGWTDEAARELSTTWSRAVSEASDRGVAFSNRLHVDFGDERNIEAMLHLKSWAPFHHFATRNIPFYLETMAEHPGLLRLWNRYNEFTEDERNSLGLTARFKGTTPAGVPGVDGLLNRLLGPGVPYFNPLVAMSITDQFKPETFDDETNTSVGRFLDRLAPVGLSPAPWISTPLQMLGAYGPNREPRNVLRHSRLVEDFTGWDPEALPKKAVSAAQAAATGKSVRTVSGSAYKDYTINKRIAELSIEYTGRANHPEFLDAMDNPKSPIYQLAASQVQRQNQVSDLTSLISPVPMKYLPATEQLIRSRGKNVLPDSPLTREQRQMVVDSGDPAGGYMKVPHKTAQSPAERAAYSGSSSGNGNDAWFEWGGSIWGPGHGQIFGSKGQFEIYQDWRKRQPKGADLSPQSFAAWAAQFFASQPPRP